MNEKLVSVYSSHNLGEADAAQAALEQAGIRAILTNELSHGIMGAATESAHGKASVSVSESDVAEAERILADFLEEESAEQEDETEARASRVIEPWPHCPECNKPRVTVCPVCSTSGSDFPRAHENFGHEEGEEFDSGIPQSSHDGKDDEDSSAPIKEQRLAVVCTTCDEPWLARFLKRCEWCGHDFGAGLKVEPPPQVREPNEAMNPRAVILMLLIGASLGGVFLWFWMLGQK